ncbi:MAG: hypothetical protein ACYTGN_09090 [Planctomycetota bacterium]
MALQVAGGALLVLLYGLRGRGPAHEVDREHGRRHLALMVGATLAGVCILSWPLFYLVLQSYVSEWPGVMCIQGVARIGLDSAGAAAALPVLVGALEISKPALAFLAGVWVVLHLAQRTATTDVRSGRVFLGLALFGLLAVIDGAAEAAYLFIPKREDLLAAGCCTTVGPGAFSRWAAFGLPSAAIDASRAATLSVSMAVLLVALLIAITMSLRWLRRGRDPGALLAVVLAGALVSVPLALAYQALVAAPAVLGVPGHLCPYCLVADSPFSIVALTCFTIGAFAVGWAATVRWIGSTDGRTLLFPLLRTARAGYLGALVVTTVRISFA